MADSKSSPNDPATPRPDGDGKTVPKYVAHRQRITFDLRFTLIVLGCFAAFGVIVHFVHEYQVDRNSTEFLNRAVAAENSGDLDEAVKNLSAYLKFRPRDVEAVIKNAELLDRSVQTGNDLYKTYFAYEEALRHDAERNDLRRRTAEIAIQLTEMTQNSNGRVELALDALDHIRVIEESRGTDADLQVLRARCELLEERYRDATLACLRAMKLKPDQIEPYTYLANLIREHYEALPNQSQIEEKFAIPEVIALLPSDDVVEVIQETASSAGSEILAQRIETLLDLMVANCEPKLEAHLNRARFRVSQGQLEEADADAKAALSRAPQDRQALQFAASLALQRAEQASQNQQPEVTESYQTQAADYLKSGEQLDEPAPELKLISSRLHILQGDHDAAQQALRSGLDQTSALLEDASLEHAIRFGNLQAELRWRLVDLLIVQANEMTDKQKRQEQLVEANELLGDIRRMAPNSWQTSFLEGRLHFARGEWPQAIAELERVRNLLGTADLTTRRQIDIYLGECYRNLANPERRVFVFRRAFEDDALWTFASLELARALADADRIDDAIQRYRLIGNLPGAPIELARLLFRKELKKPKDERDWQLVADAIQAEETLRDRDNVEETADIDVLRAEILWQQGQFEEATQLLQQSRKNHPQSFSVITALTNTILQSTELDIQNRVRMAGKILDEAAQDFGESYELTLAKIQFARALPASQAKESIQELLQDIDRFSLAEQQQLLTSASESYSSIGDWQSAQKVTQQLAAIAPRQLLPQLRLYQIATRNGEQQLAQRQLQVIESIEGTTGPSGNVIKARELIELSQSQSEQTSSEQSKANLEQARELLQLARSQRPNWVLVTSLLGDVERLLGNEDIAIEQYRRAIEQGLHSRELVSYVAQYYYEKQLFGEADRLINNVTQETPQLLSDNLARMKWQIARELQREDEALGLLEDQIEQGTTNFRDYIWLSQLRIANGETGERVETPLRQATHNFPKEPAVWLALVNYLARVNRIDDAVAELEAAKDILPAEPPYLAPVTLGRGMEMIGRKSEAEDYYRQAFAADSQTPSVRVELADFYTRHNDFDKASPLLDSLSTDPQVPQTVRDWATRRKAQIVATGEHYSDLAKALDMLDTGNEQGGGVLSSFDLRTKAQILSRLDTKADKRKWISVLETLLSRGEATAGERLQLARLYNQLEMFRQARQTYVDFLTEFPEAITVIVELAFSLSQTDQLDEAETWLARAQSIAPESIAVSLLEFQILAKRGNRIDAITKLNEFAQRQAESIDVLRAINDLLANDNGRAVLRQIAQFLQQPGQQQKLKLFQDGLILLQNGQREEAGKKVSPVFEQTEVSNLVRAYYYRSAAQQASALGDHVAAEGLARKAIEIANQQQDTILLISFLAKQGRHALALDLCEEQLWKSMPAEQAAQFSVAVLRTGTPRNAEIQRVDALLTQAMIDSTNPGPLAKHLADLKDLSGDYQQALGLYEQVLQHDEEDVVALNNLAYLGALLGQDTRRALDLVNKAIEIKGPIGALLDTRGVIYLKRKQYQKAIADLTIAIDENPSASSRFRLAQAHMLQGNRDESKRVFLAAKDDGMQGDTVHPLEQEEFETVKSQLIPSS